MKHRNQIVDVFKILSAFFVVFLHFPFPGLFGKVVFSIARFAVPFFFIVSGYYYSKSDKSVQLVKTWSKIKYIFSLLLVSELLAFIQRLLNHYEFQYSFLNNVKSVIISSLYNYNAEKWRAISFTPLFNYSAWFLAQLIIVYAVFALITKYRLYNVAKVIIPICFIFGFFLIRIYNFTSIALPPYLDYFFMFMGVPFFSFGYYLKEHSFMPRINTLSLFFLILLGVALSVLESFFISTANLFLGSLVIDFALTALFIKFADASMKTQLGKLLSFCGDKLSLYVYILHSFVGGYVIAIINKLFGLNKWINAFMPLLICIFTLFVSVIVYKINSIIGKKMKEWKANTEIKH